MTAPSAAALVLRKGWLYSCTEAMLVHVCHWLAFNFLMSQAITQDQKLAQLQTYKQQPARYPAMHADSNQHTQQNYQVRLNHTVTPAFESSPL
jgi:hypothetical protein